MKNQYFYSHYIAMASKAAANYICPSDEHTENALKCIRAALKKTENIKLPYQASKAAVRNKEKYWTAVLDSKTAWSNKYDRVLTRLKSGFFCEKTKPYKPVGKLYLEPSDLLLNSISSELKEQISTLTVFNRCDFESQKSLGQLTKKLPKLVTAAPPKCGQPTPGIIAITERIAEVRRLKKLIYTRHSLVGYFKKAIEKKQSPTSLICKTSTSLKPSDSSIIVEDEQKFIQLASMKSAKRPRKQRMRRLSSLKSSDATESDGPPPIVVPQWKKDLNQIYLRNKLKAINSLLCAVFNMKLKSIKQSNLLSYKRVENLMKSDIMVDETGKPTAWKAGNRRFSVFNGAGDDSRRSLFCTKTTDVVTEDSDIFKKIEKGRASSKASLTTFKGTKSQRRLSTQQNKLFHETRIESWEDFLNDGEKTQKFSNLNSQKLMPLKKRITIEQLASESSTPWLSVMETEKIIRKKKANNFMDEPPERTHAEILEDLKEDFLNIQIKLEADTEAECAKQRRYQYRNLRNIYNAIRLGLHRDETLERMRAVIKFHKENRNETSMQPFQWFVDLKTESLQKTEVDDSKEIIKTIKKIERFKFENQSTIPYGKEKLCLLVRSMPAHILLPEPMMEAIVFVLDKILDSPPEMLHCWLIGRKLDKISNIDKYSIALKESNTT